MKSSQSGSSTASFLSELLATASRVRGALTAQDLSAVSPDAQLYAIVVTRGDDRVELSGCKLTCLRVNLSDETVTLSFKGRPARFDFKFWHLNSREITGTDLYSSRIFRKQLDAEEYANTLHYVRSQV